MQSPQGDFAGVAATSVARMEGVAMTTPFRRRRTLRHAEERIFKALMICSLLVIAGGLGAILLTVILKGLPALTIQMLTQTPSGGYYLGGEGGILNAIAGSLCLAGGGTFVALLLGLPISLYLHSGGCRPSSTGHSASRSCW
jgi:ABC-type phosphate transport system permease subunit